MQPTYLPWLGYFALMDSVDQFILLDSVEFSKQSWHQRNRVKTSIGPTWLTVPVLKKHASKQLIVDTKISTTARFPQSHINTIRQAYGKAPYFETYGIELIKLLSGKHANLCDLNICLIDWIALSLGIKTPCQRSSSMEFIGVKSRRVVKICQQTGAERYVSPPGASDYLDESLFEASGISLSYFNYEHPIYPQRYGNFEPYLSVVDLLMNVGPDSLQIIRSGNRELQD